MKNSKGEKKMKIRNKFKGIQAKIVLYFVALFLGISLIIGILQYNSNKNIQFKNIRDDATQLAVAAALLVDGDSHERINSINSEEYEDIQNTLQLFMKETNASGIYTLIKNENNKTQFIVDADEDPVELGYEYEYLPAMQTAFEGVPSADNEITKDEWGSVLSGYADIKNSIGETVAIVGVDIDANYIDKQNKQQLLLLVVSNLLGAVLMIALSLFISRRISKPIQKLGFLFEDLSLAGGDLTKKIDIKTGDEIEYLARSVNKFIDNIRNIVIQVKDTGENVAASALFLDKAVHDNQTVLEEVNTAIENIAVGASEQARDVSDIAFGVQDISKDLNENENKVTAINDAAGETRQLIYEGLEAVTNQSNKTDENMEAFSKVTTVVDKLVKEIEEVEMILSTISAISSQTNLLALNAAIEAARAGEHGRGFSVVADEVRSLAEESATSTQEISNILKTINKDANEAVIQIAHANVIAQEQKQAVDSTGVTFNDITKNVESIMIAIGVINTSFKAIGDHTTDISSKLEDVSAVSEENAAISQEVSASSEEQNAAMQEMAIAAQKLNYLSTDLEKIISIFKI